MFLFTNRITPILLYLIIPTTDLSPFFTTLATSSSAPYRLFMHILLYSYFHPFSSWNIKSTFTNCTPYPSIYIMHSSWTSLCLPSHLYEPIYLRLPNFGINNAMIYLYNCQPVLYFMPVIYPPTLNKLLHELGLLRCNPHRHTFKMLLHRLFVRAVHPGTG